MACIWRFWFYFLFAYIILSSDSFTPVSNFFANSSAFMLFITAEGVFFFNTLHFFPDLEIFIQLTPCTCSFRILYALRRLSLYHLFHSWIIIVLDFYNKHTHCNILIISFTVFFLVKRREIIIKLLKFTKSRYISQSSTRRQQLLYKNLNRKILICKEQRIGILKGWLVE